MKTSLFDYTSVIEAPVDGNQALFLAGPAGAGKSQALVQRLRFLLQSGVPGYSILVILPDRATTVQFDDAVSELDLGPFGAVDLHTYYGLASRLVRTFWPLVARDAGFAQPQRQPIFLTYETAQYVMSQLIEPLLEQGYFEGLSMRPQRIVSQLLDNLNKAAINGYPISEVESQLKAAWTGEDREERLRYYEQAQDCIELFREHCLAHGLLDISLTIEVFHQHLVENPTFWRYFTERYRHILVDNLEESVPVAQDLIRRLLPLCDSGLLVFDQGGGFRVFLGVDAEGALGLRELCTESVTVEESTTSSPAMAAFASQIGQRLGQPAPVSANGNARQAVVDVIETRYRSEMIRRVAEEITQLVERGVSPGDVAVVAPYADGVLRFSLSEAFKEAGIPFDIIRRFESFREEPVVRACLTLAALAHPDWGIHPPAYDVAEALNQTIEELDPVRAALAARLLYDDAGPALRSRDVLEMGEHERIGGEALESYDQLHAWIETYRQEEPAPLDHFLRRLFGELLSHPDFDPEDAAVYAKLVASAEWFRQAAPAMGLESKSVGQQYLEMIYEGVVAAEYLTTQDVTDEADAITLVAPIYTYLLSGEPVRYQFWLDVGSMSWWEPPHQPLTNPHVLARRWPKDAPWTDAVDYETRNATLYRLVRGLTQRCSDGLYLCTSDLEMSGEPQDSPLLRAVQRVLQEPE